MGEILKSNGRGSTPIEDTRLADLGRIKRVVGIAETLCVVGGLVLTGSAEPRTLAVGVALLAATLPVSFVGERVVFHYEKQAAKKK